MSRSRLRMLRSAVRGAEVTLGEDGHLAQESAPEEQALQRALTDGAADIVELAQQRAGELMRRAAEQSAALQHDAYRDGRERGYVDGQAAARADLVEALDLVQAIARDAKGVRDRLLAGAERELVELVLACVQAVLGERVRIEPALVLDTVEHALRRAGAQEVMRIRVHPQDGALVQAQLVERIGEVARDWEVLPDGAIGIGGCIVDTRFGQVDARLDAQLSEIARLLRAQVSEDWIEHPEANAA